MYELIIKEEFDRSFSRLKDVKIKKQIWNKVFELKIRTPIAKKLVGMDGDGRSDSVFSKTERKN